LLPSVVKLGKSKDASGTAILKKQLVFVVDVISLVGTADCVVYVEPEVDTK
jgi:hypothetical protein